MRGLKYTPAVLWLLILLSCKMWLISIHLWGPNSHTMQLISTSCSWFKSIIPSVYENYIDHTGRVQGTPAIYPQSMTEGLGFLLGLCSREFCSVWYSYIHPIILTVTFLTDIIWTRLDNMRVIETILILTINMLVAVGIMTQTILL